MSWGEWMVPDFSPEMEFQQRALELELRSTIQQDPGSVIGLCLFLARQNAVQASILRKATRRISELEVARSEAEAQASRARRWWPWSGL